MLAAEQRAEIVVLWALGDADGPLDSEVKIGLTTRRAFQSQVTAMSAARARKLARRVEVYIQGQAAGLRLRAALEHHLSVHGMEIDRPWFRVRLDQISALVSLLAAAEHVSIMSEDEAKSVEQREFMKIMDQSIEV